MKSNKENIADALDEAQKDYEFTGQGIGLRNFQVSHILRKLETTCPFCKENDFDLIGLKQHLERGDCEKYVDIDILSLRPRLSDLKG